MKKYVAVLLFLGILIVLWIRYSQWYIYIDAPFFQSDTNISSNTIAWELHISPYWVEDEIIDVLTRTKYSIKMREYSITMREVITVLKNKATLWADVDIILENYTYWWNNKNWTEFKQKLVWTNAEVKSDEHLWTNFVHAKTIVTDDTVVFSTANLWYQWFWNNREYWFETKDEGIVENMKWLHTQDREWNTIHPVDIHEALWFCPINCRRKLNAFIAWAQESIHIQAQYLKDPLLLQQLIRRQKNWIEIYVILWKNQEADELQWLDWVYLLYEPYLHAKNILVDSKELLITSMNLSTNAIENNREIGIVTQDKKAVNSFLYQFNKDKKNAKEI